jgi:hypothetical protein
VTRAFDCNRHGCASLAQRDLQRASPNQPGMIDQHRLQCPARAFLDRGKLLLHQPVEVLPVDAAPVKRLCPGWVAAARQKAALPAHGH